MSIIVVGTTNPAKLAAVRELQAKWPLLHGHGSANIPHTVMPEIVGIAVESGVRAQPLSLEDTIEGAENRARAAYEHFCNPKIMDDRTSLCDVLAIGIESGLMVAPVRYEGGYLLVRHRPMDVCACVLFDGNKSAVGLSGAWELPAEVADLALHKRADLNEAFHKLGYTEDLKIGNGAGVISLLSDGRLTRTEYTKQAIEMALVSWAGL